MVETIVAETQGSGSPPRRALRFWSFYVVESAAGTDTVANGYGNMTVAEKEDTLEKAETPEKEADEKPKETTVEFLASLAAVLVTGLFIITFVMQAFEIPSSSMENTLLIGDHVFVNRIQFAPKTSWVGPLFPYRDPKHGEIVVFLHPDPATAGMYVVRSE